MTIEEIKAIREYLKESDENLMELIDNALINSAKGEQVVRELRNM